MKTGAFLCVVLAGAATVLAQKKIEISFENLTPTPTPTPAPAPAPALLTRVRIDPNDVEPFDQPPAKSISEKAAVKFQPKFHIVDGCHPYPAVDAAGGISRGLLNDPFSDSKCGGSLLGSQVYGRSAWHRQTWAIVYLLFFPKESSHRYGFQNVVVWINNPAVDNSTILAVTPSGYHGYSKNAPPRVNTVDGTHPKIKYKRNAEGNSAFQWTVVAGETQNLIMWDQLTAAARLAFNEASWDGIEVAISENHFNQSLEDSWNAWHD